ncbi:MAG: B12-binding domain-containing radical SAM protein [bacterium]|nr:B12-binding domain-containing radical SAM protein [bacterium]
MKIVLISAPNMHEEGDVSPSLSLAVLSSCLKRQDIDCTCIDGNFLHSFRTFKRKLPMEVVEQKVLNECMELLERSAPDVVGISAWGAALPFVIVLSRLIAEAFPGVPVILGGLRYGVLAEMLLQYCRSIDAVVVGEGETALSEILARISGKRDFYGVKGVVHRYNGDIRVEAPGSPLPAELWEKPDYSSFVFPVKDIFMLEGSRSCSYKCLFCCINQEPLRRKEPESFAREILDLKEEKNIDVIYLADNFIPLKGSWTNRFCDYLIESGSPIRWTCCTRADNMDAATIEKMVRAGCVHLFLGIESVSYDTLTYIHKAPSAYKYLSHLMENIRLMVSLGLRLRVSTIIGFPFEGVEDMQQTVDFVLMLMDMGISARTGPIVVYPGSELWDMYLKKKIQLRKIMNPEVFGGISGLFTSDFKDIPYFVPNNFLPKHWFLPQAEFEAILWDAVGQMVRHEEGR